MKYIICEGTPDGEYNAQSKARNDAEKIIIKNGYEKYCIPTRYGVQTNKLLKFKQLIDYKNNFNIWKKYINKLNSGDIIVIQYPLLNSMTNFEKIIELCTLKKISTVMLIHDLDSLRFTNIPRKAKEDKYVLNNASYIIAHNDKMKQELIKMGNDDKKIIELGIFDYLFENEIISKNRSKNDPIIIAGNLSKNKAKYISTLKDVQNTKFNLYGKGYEKESGDENIDYKGAFLPEEIPNKLEGSFGLVWDGTSKDSCDGNFGNYIRYNNPHKISLYLASKIPVIVWKEAALSDFVEKNNIGLAVNNLDEIKEKINKMSEEEYKIKEDNAEKISIKIRNGEFLSKALKEVENKVLEN